MKRSKITRTAFNPRTTPMKSAALARVTSKDAKAVID